MFGEYNSKKGTVFFLFPKNDKSGILRSLGGADQIWIATMTIRLGWSWLGLLLCCCFGVFHVVFKKLLTDRINWNLTIHHRGTR